MSYSKLIKQGVDLAFKSIGDLATDVTFSKVQLSFDFNDGIPKEKEDGNVTVRALALSKTRYSSSRNTYVKKITTEIVDDISCYDRVTINGDEWRIATPISNDGFLLNLEIYKEKNDG